MGTIHAFRSSPSGVPEVLTVKISVGNVRRPVIQVMTSAVRSRASFIGFVDILYTTNDSSMYVGGVFCLLPIRRCGHRMAGRMFVWVLSGLFEWRLDGGPSDVHWIFVLGFLCTFYLDILNDPLLRPLFSGCWRYNVTRHLRERFLRLLNFLRCRITKRSGFTRQGTFSYQPGSSFVSLFWVSRRRLFSPYFGGV